MKRIRTISNLILVYFLCCCCCKNDPPEMNSLIGTWSIKSIDSIYCAEAPYFNTTFAGNLPWAGTLTFSIDSTGYLSSSIPIITDTSSCFNWSLNKMTNRIEFSFANGETYAHIKKQTMNHLEIYLRKYFNGQAWIGVAWFYSITLEK